MKRKRTLSLLCASSLLLGGCGNEAAPAETTPFFETETTVSQTANTNQQTEVTTPQSETETTTNTSPAKTQKPKESKTVTEKQTDPIVDLLKKNAAFILKNKDNIDGSYISPNGILQKNDLCSADLWDICGDPTPEFILTVYGKDQLRDGLRSEQQNKLFFSVAENGDPFYMGYSHSGNFAGFYTINEELYMLIYGVGGVSPQDTNIEPFPPGLVKIEDPIEPAFAPDFHGMCEKSFDKFMECCWVFFRYSMEDRSNPDAVPPERKKLFYYEDTDQYEAYMVTQRVLDITGIEIDTSMIGWMFDSTSLHYVTTRQEYAKIKAKLTGMMKKIPTEPILSSDQMCVSEIDGWISTLS